MGSINYRITGLLGPERSLMISSAIPIECTNVTQRDRQTDGRTDRHRATAKTSLTHSVVR